MHATIGDRLHVHSNAVGASDRVGEDVIRLTYVPA